MFDKFTDKPKPKPEHHTTTIRLPVALRRKLKYYEGDGLIKNLQDAVMRGLHLLIAEIERGKR